MTFKMKANLYTRIPPELMDALKKLAKSEGRSLNNYVTRLLEKAVKEQEKA